MNVVEAKTPTPERWQPADKQNPGVVWYHSGSNSGIHFRPCTDLFGFVARIFISSRAQAPKLYKF